MERRPLTGRRVVTTRDEPGELDSLLTRRGAVVVHVPLIAIGDPADGGIALRGLLDRLDGADWLVVTSKHGARRVGAAAARHPGLRLAAVGTATAQELAAAAGRPVDLVPDRQTGAQLVATFPPAPSGGLVVVAQADRADPSLVDALRARGWRVDAAVAYATHLRAPTAAERTAALSADAVAFASGSAAIAWSETLGRSTPPVVVAIGPTTASVARERGLQVTHIAADHSVEGLADELAAALSAHS